MKKVLLTMAAMAAVATVNAQQLYNWFDPADCDADGWLWFNTQEKIDKYAGFATLDNTPKIQLQSTTFFNAENDFDYPYGDPTIQGYNAEGVQGGDGSWTGALVLCGTSTANGSDAPNGAGFMMQLPDVGELGLKLSTESDYMCVGLRGADGWKEDVDMVTIYTYWKMGFVNKPLASTHQFTWNNIQDVYNAATDFGFPKEAGKKFSVLLRNNRGDDLLVQAIKVLVLSDTGFPFNPGSGVAGIEADDTAVPVEFFNMQGVKVSGDEPGLYIRRQGSKVTKILKK